MEIIIVVVVALIALGVGAYMQQRAPDAPVRTTRLVLPEQLDRNDFVRPEAQWLVAVFTSATCETCAKVWTSTQLVESEPVAIQNISFQDDADLHERYNITAVPSVVVADADGVNRAEFLGPPTSAELWATLAEVREAAEAADASSPTGDAETP